MKHTEKKYALQRVDELARQKHEQLRIAKNESDCATIYAALKAGKVDIKRPEVTVSRYYNPTDFNKYITLRPSVKLQDFSAQEKEITDQANAIKDKIMLGDSQEAMALLEEFANLTVE